MIDILRRKGRITRTLLILEMVRSSPGDQGSLAEPVGITPQAVSEYLSKMKDEGLVTAGDQGPRPTVKGVDMLHHDLLELKEFVDVSIGELDIVRSTDAIAKGRIGKGDRVYLIMEDGLLYASTEGSGSTGTAERDALPGEMVPISELSGLVEMEQGTIRFLEIVPARKGGGKGTVTENDVLEACGPCELPHRIAPLDLEAAALLKRSGLDYDLELPPPEALIELITRGLDVIAIGTPFSISRSVRFMEGRKGAHSIERSRLSSDPS